VAGLFNQTLHEKLRTGAGRGIKQLGKGISQSFSDAEIDDVPPFAHPNVKTRSASESD
jgi:hypothetical protein